MNKEVNECEKDASDRGQNNLCFEHPSFSVIMKETHWEHNLFTAVCVTECNPETTKIETVSWFNCLMRKRERYMFMWHEKLCQRSISVWKDFPGNLKKWKWSKNWRGHEVWGQSWERTNGVGWKESERETMTERLSLLLQAEGNHCLVLKFFSPSTGVRQDVSDSLPSFDSHNSKGRAERHKSPFTT